MKNLQGLAGQALASRIPRSAASRRRSAVSSAPTRIARPSGRSPGPKARACSTFRPSSRSTSRTSPASIRPLSTRESCCSCRRRTTTASSPRPRPTARARVRCRAGRSSRRASRRESTRLGRGQYRVARKPARSRRIRARAAAHPRERPRAAAQLRSIARRAARRQHEPDSLSDLGVLDRPGLRRRGSLALRPPLRVRQLVEHLAQLLTPGAADRAEVRGGFPGVDELVLVDREAVGPVAQEISGNPTDKLDFIVESIDTSAHFAASFNDRPAVMTRSRIGLPYFASPSWKYGVSGVDSMKLPTL